MFLKLFVIKCKSNVAIAEIDVFILNVLISISDLIVCFNYYRQCIIQLCAYILHFFIRHFLIVMIKRCHAVFAILYFANEF